MSHHNPQPTTPCSLCGQPIQKEGHVWLLVTGDYSQDRVKCPSAGWGGIHQPAS